MGKYLLKRVLAMLLTLFIITSLSFFLMRIIPGGIVPPGTDETIEKALIERYHLDKPLFEQYFIFIKNYATLDFGESITLYPSRPVFGIIASKIPVSLELNIFSILLVVPVGAILGITAALKKNTLVDRSISMGVVLCVSVPSFIFAVLLQYVFAFKLGWFPLVVGNDELLTGAKFFSMILPILALSFGGIATITRYMRAELFEALNSEYMLLAKSKGLSQVQATIRHAIRNSFIPLCNVVVPMFMSVLSGSMVVEQLFLIPGIGSLAVGAINSKDYFLASAVLFFYSLIGLISILLVDISYGIVDPRIRIGGGKANG